jgi:hypothetical protein
MIGIIRGMGMSETTDTGLIDDGGDPLELVSKRVSPSIHELEKILSSNESPPLEIMPDGQIRVVGDENWVPANPKNPITFQQAIDATY